MKTDDKNVYEPEQKRHYKKRYLLRKLEEHEAEQEIKGYVEVCQDPILENEPVNGVKKNMNLE